MCARLFCVFYSCIHPTPPNHSLALYHPKASPIFHIISMVKTAIMWQGHTGQRRQPPHLHTHTHTHHLYSRLLFREESSSSLLEMQDWLWFLEDEWTRRKVIVFDWISSKCQGWRENLFCLCFYNKTAITLF